MPPTTPSPTHLLRLDHLILALDILRFLEHVHLGDDDADAVSDRNPFGLSLHVVRRTLARHLGSKAADRLEQHIAFHCNIREGTLARMLRAQRESLGSLMIDTAPLITIITQGREMNDADIDHLQRFLRLIGDGTMTIDQLQTTPPRISFAGNRAPRRGN
ncbi:hypothetical protein HY632_04465 [Candidatus Uhrbacteria bacterium]|nr:hypothetical protein [Candidatus Uhrbacteria bacterium]